MRYLFAIILFAFINNAAFADDINSLALSEAEMQKLKKYFPADDTDHLTWKGDPITITLPIGKEKRLVFSSHVTVDIKSSLNNDQLRLFNDDKSLYLTALKMFPTTRIFVTLKDTGEVLLIDLVTNSSASNTTQYIDVKKNSIPHDINADSIPTIDNDSNINDKATTYVDLVRFAWQQSYAPERLLKNSASYARAPMHTQKFVSGLVYGDKVVAFPQSSWISGQHYVTAILLRNKYQHMTHIDIRRELCGDWQAATLYPRTTLKSYGNKDKDSTMLFLVSNRPFGDVLGVCHGNA